MMRLFMALLALAMVACEYREETHEVGYKGQARVNPYLAAERYLEHYHYDVRKQRSWPNFDQDDIGMAILPSSVMTAAGHVDALEDWVTYGGHAVLLLENGESYLSDWRESYFFRDTGTDEGKEALDNWLDRAGISISRGWDDDYSSPSASGSADSVTLAGQNYEVWMESSSTVSAPGQSGVQFVSTEYGSGRITIVSDARPFRNRYIGNYDHALLLRSLAELSPMLDYGSVAFIRNASLSFWAMLWDHAWAAIIGLTLLIIFWLWKSLPRFGPIDSFERTDKLRAYEHHLEALGDFHWRLDKCQGLLGPMRRSLLDRANQLALASGEREPDVFQLMADRAGISRDRAQRAMTFEQPRDIASFTRLVADLQSLHHSLP